MHCHAGFIHPKNGCGRWSAFLSIFIFSCTDINIHCLTMYKRWHTHMYSFLSKCYRKADHLTPATAILRGCEHCMYRMANSCTTALSIPLTKAVQTHTNGIPQGNTLSRERNCMFMVWDWMKRDEPCTDKCIHCTATVQTCMYKTIHVFLCLYHVQIRYIHLHIVFTYMFVYMLV